MSESSTKMPICQNEPHTKQYQLFNIYANDRMIRVLYSMVFEPTKT